MTEEISSKAKAGRLKSTKCTCHKYPTSCILKRINDSDLLQIGSVKTSIAPRSATATPTHRIASNTHQKEDKNAPRSLSCYRRKLDYWPFSCKENYLLINYSIISVVTAIAREVEKLKTQTRHRARLNEIA